MLRSTVVNVVVFLFIHFDDIYGWRPFTINLTNSTYTFDSKKVDMNITIKNNLMNAYFTFKEPIAHPYTQIEIFMQSPDSGRYDMELINRTIDTCKFFQNSLYEPLMQLLYGILLEHGDLPKSCPIKAKEFYMQNVKLDADRFPPYLPERKGYFMLKFLVKENNLTTELSQSTIQYEIKNSALKRFKGVKL